MLLLWLVPVPIATADVLWREDFEDAFVEERWYSDFGVWEFGIPTSGPTNAPPISRLVGTVLGGDYPEGVTSRVVRDESFVVPPTDENPRLRLRHWHSFHFSDYGSVLVKPAGGTWETLQSYTWSSSGWEFASLDLTKYAGQTVQVGFLLHSEQTYLGGGAYATYVGPGWYLDDVEVFTGPMVFTNPEDFEQPDFWDHWSADNGIWQVGRPTSGPGAAYGGSNVAATILAGDYPDGYESRLISPVFTVPSAVNPRLRMRHWHSFDSNDYGSAQVKPAGGTWETLQSYTQSSSGWEFASLDLTKYAGQTVQVGFLLHSEQTYLGGGAYATSVGPGWYLDDLEVFSGPKVFTNPEDFERPDFWDHWYADNGIWQVGRPTSGPGAAYGGRNVAATILAGNYPDGYESRLISPVFTVPSAVNPRLRLRHWHSFDSNDYGSAQVKPAGGAWETLQSYTWSSSGWEFASLDLTKYAGQTVQVGFLLHSEETYLGGGAYATSVGPGWYLDDVEVFSGPMVLTNPEGFERPDFWDHWSADNGIWQVGRPTSGPGAAYEGRNVAATILAGDYPDGYESRLISPAFTVPSAVNPRLRLRHWYSFGPRDYGSLQVKPAGGTWEELARYTALSGDWTYPLLPLAKYAGRAVQIGFLLHSELTYLGGGAYATEVGPGWYLDDLKILTDCLTVPRAIIVKEANLMTFVPTKCEADYVVSLAPGAPEGASIDPTLGIFTWVPEECQGPSTNLITITLTDPTNLTLQPLDFETITVIVEEVNEPPMIGSIAPLRLQPGVHVEFDAAEHVYDPDCPAQTLTYSLDGCSPANAAIDAVTGQLSWTPTPEQAAQTNTLCLRVTDDRGSSATWTILAGPFPPEQSPKISRFRLDGTSIELSVDNATAGQLFTLESTFALKDVPEVTVWSEARSFTWQVNPVQLEGVLSGDHPIGFFRLKVSR